MTEGNTYETKVEGCGEEPVKFIVAKQLTSETHENEESGETDRKVEVAVTGKGTLIGRKVEYSDEDGNPGKKETHKKFADLHQVGAWMDKDKPEEAAALDDLKGFLENGEKLDDLDV